MFNNKRTFDFLVKYTNIIKKNTRKFWDNPLKCKAYFYTNNRVEQYYSRN